MAIKIIAKVWDHFPNGGAELLALLAMADWSDNDGHCFPSMASIAKKTRLSESQARRVVHNLINDGFVEVVGNAMGGPPGSSRQYRIVLSRLIPSMNASPTGSADARGTTSTHDTPRAEETGSMDARDGCHPCAETPSAHDTLTVIEPSITVSNSISTGRKKKSEKTLSQFLDECKSLKIHPISADDPIFEYAERIGISEDMLAVCWSEFKSRYVGNVKRYKDWRSTYRNAVKRNWFKLWFLKEGEIAQWTTAGEQARRAAA